MGTAKATLPLHKFMDKALIKEDNMKPIIVFILLTLSTVAHGQILSGMKLTGSGATISGKEFCENPSLQKAKTCIPVVNRSKKNILKIEIVGVQTFVDVKYNEAVLLYSLKTELGKWHFIITKINGKKEQILLDGDIINKIGVVCHNHHCKP